jgi:anti-sigma regulatory factor (Ser/Thr protein kinase)
VIDRINSLMLNLGPLAMTTLAYLVIDPAAEALELVSAGHPPPLYIAPDGAAEFLWPNGGVPLGAAASAVYAPDRFPFPSGATVVLYTDGLVERRGESIEVGLERLRGLAAGMHDVEALCATLVERLVPEAPDDDIAFIAARVPPLGDHLATRWPVTPDSLAPIRYLLQRWLLNRGVVEQRAYDIVVAAQEACANAVEHAYGPSSAEFELDARWDDGVVTITVSDHGQWREPRGTNRGRGLPLMRALMDEVEVHHDDGGTSVTLTRRLGRP